MITRQASVQMICLLGMLLGHGSLHSTIYYETKNSILNLGPNARLGLGGNMTVQRGTINRHESAIVTGGEIIVNDAVITRDTKSTAQGNFKQNVGGSIVLNGDKNLSLDNGLLNNEIQIQNIENKIEGSGEFGGNIVLQDSSTTLTLAIDAVFNHEIQLNGGTLYLESDLVLGDQGRIVGNGKIEGFKSSSLTISGTQSQWNTDLTFKDMRAIQFNGPAHFTGKWTFEGENIMLGNGCPVNTMQQGKIEVPDNSVLKMYNITIVNLTNSTLLLEQNSQIRFSNAFVHNAEDIILENGIIIVEGGTTLMLRDNDFIFLENALLLVDSVTMWVDSFDNAGIALFGKVDAESQKFLSFINGGTVKQITDQSQVDSLASRLLLSGFVTDDLELDESVFLSPKNQIKYYGDAELTGSGAAIQCTGGENPQIIVNAEKTLRMREVEILRINSQTFDLKEGSFLQVARRVLMEFNDDVRLTKGDIQMIGDTDVWHIRGVGGRKKLIIDPEVESFLFDIKSNTLLLEDIELVGIENIKYESKIVNGTKVVGAVALLGSSIAQISKDTNLSIVVQGRGAGIDLVKSNLTLNGNILFGDAPDNVLNVHFSLQDSSSDLPSVNFGEGLCVMTSVGGRAGVKFHDTAVTVNNLTTGAFVAGERSHFSGKELSVEGNPIKQESTYFTLDDGLDLKSKTLDRPIEIALTRTPTPFEQLGGPHLSAYQYNRMPKIRDKAKQEYQDYLDGLAMQHPLLVRSGKIPAPLVRLRYKLGMARAMGDLSLAPGSELNNFSLDKEEAFTAHLTGNARIEQRRSRKFMALPLRQPSVLRTDSSGVYDGFKASDKLFVSGLKNAFALYSDFEFLGELVMEENSDLTFELNNGAVLTFGSYKPSITPDWESSSGTSGYKLTLPKNTALTFKGSGTVRFADGSEIIMQGTAFDEATSEDDSTVFDDDRPELSIENFAQLSTNDHRRLTLKGRGKVNVRNNGEIFVGDGKLSWGSQSTDYIDCLVERKGELRLAVPRSITSEEYTPQAHMSFKTGFFNLVFDHQGALRVGDRGLCELSLDNNEQTIAFINAFVMSNNALLDVKSSGTLALGDNKYSITEGSTTHPMFWDNRDGEVTGEGFIKHVASNSARTTFIAKIQGQNFDMNDKENVSIVKKLATASKNLITAIDYYDESGVHKLLTGDGKLVTLETGDVITFESTSSRTQGTVFGTQADGRRFRITKSGVRVAYN